MMGRVKVRYLFDWGEGMIFSFFLLFTNRTYFIKQLIPEATKAFEFLCLYVVIQWLASNRNQLCKITHQDHRYASKWLLLILGKCLAKSRVNLVEHDCWNHGFFINDLKQSHQNEIYMCKTKQTCCMTHTRIFAFFSSNWSLFNWSPCNGGAGLLKSTGTGSWNSECNVVPLTLKAAHPVGAAMSIFTFFLMRYLEEETTMQCYSAHWAEPSKHTSQGNQGRMTCQHQPGLEKK